MLKGERLVRKGEQQSGRKGDAQPYVSAFRATLDQITLYGKLPFRVARVVAGLLPTLMFLHRPFMLICAGFHR